MKGSVNEFKKWREEEKKSHDAEVQGKDIFLLVTILHTAMKQAAAEM
jgi:hypothetical protein